MDETTKTIATGGWKLIGNTESTIGASKVTAVTWELPLHAGSLIRIDSFAVEGGHDGQPVVYRPSSIVLYLPQGGGDRVELLHL